MHRRGGRVHRAQVPQCAPAHGTRRVNPASAGTHANVAAAAAAPPPCAVARTFLLRTTASPRCTTTHHDTPRCTTMRHNVRKMQRPHDAPRCSTPPCGTTRPAAVPPTARPSSMAVRSIAEDDGVAPQVRFSLVKPPRCGRGRRAHPEMLAQMRALCTARASAANRTKPRQPTVAKEAHHGTPSDAQEYVQGCSAFKVRKVDDADDHGRCKVIRGICTVHTACRRRRRRCCAPALVGAAVRPAPFNDPRSAPLPYRCTSSHRSTAHPPPQWVTAAPAPSSRSAPHGPRRCDAPALPLLRPPPHGLPTAGACGRRRPLVHPPERRRAPVPRSAPLFQGRRQAAVSAHRTEATRRARPGPTEYAQRVAASCPASTSTRRTPRRRSSAHAAAHPSAASERATFLRDAPHPTPRFAAAAAALASCASPCAVHVAAMRACARALVRRRSRLSRALASAAPLARSLRPPRSTVRAATNRQHRHTHRRSATCPIQRCCPRSTSASLPSRSDSPDCAHRRADAAAPVRGACAVVLAYSVARIRRDAPHALHRSTRRDVPDPVVRLIACDRAVLRGLS